MNTSDSHSCVTHSLPKRRIEKISVCGILLVSRMYCPVLRCHQKSGSVIGCEARVKITAMKTILSSGRVDCIFRSPLPDWVETLTIASAASIKVELHLSLNASHNSMCSIRHPQSK